MYSECLFLLTGAFFATVAFFEIFAAVFMLLTAFDKGEQGAIKGQFAGLLKFKII
jgi:hypothetical protein